MEARTFFRYGMLDKKLQTAMEYKLFDDFFKNERGYFVNDILAAYRLHKKAKSYTAPYEIRLAELDSVRKTKNNNILLKTYYKFRRIFYYFIDNNFLKVMKEKAKNNF